MSKDGMVNQVRMAEEYWYSLQEIAADFGFKSRNDLISEILRVYVMSQDSGYYERGLSRAKYMQTHRKVAGKDPVKIAAVIVPGMSKYSVGFVPMKLWFKDGREIEVEADGPLTALKMIEMDVSLTARDLDERVDHYEVMEKLTEEPKKPVFFRMVSSDGKDLTDNML
jgi:hypothetical protein